MTTTKCTLPDPRIGEGKRKEQHQKKYHVLNCITRQNLSLEDEMMFKEFVRGEPYNVFATSSLFSTPYCVIRFYFKEYLNQCIVTDFDLNLGLNEFYVETAEKEKWMVRVLC